MKILTGSLRGRPIHFKPNVHVRPTADKVRKAIFDSLQSLDLSGKKILDLYSGSGAMGIEALSNSAGHVTFVEQNRGQALSIEKNLREMKLENRTQVLARDVFKAIDNLSQKGESYDLIFLDPPYEKDLALQTLQALAISDLLAEGALVIAECNKREDLPETVGSLRKVREKLYGDSKIVFYSCPT